MRIREQVVVFFVHAFVFYYGSLAACFFLFFKFAAFDPRICRKFPPQGMAQKPTKRAVFYAWLGRSITRPIIRNIRALRREMSFLVCHDPFTFALVG